MNASYHYYAVKSIARAAGFREPEAQRIAVFSQFIDDYDKFNYITCSNIPCDIASNPVYDLVVDSALGNFNPVMTGFAGIDYALMPSPRFQRFTVSPFHFIGPKTPYGKSDRTAPAAPGDGSPISEMLGDAKKFYRKKNGDRNSLMKIGMLLHTFADTYAHEYFSGFRSEVNNADLIHVYDNITGDEFEAKAFPDEGSPFGAKENFSDAKVNRSETGENRKEVAACAESGDADFDGESAIEIGIGHFFAKHVPDYPYVTYDMTLNSRGGFRVVTKNNTEAYLKCSKHIYDYLRGLDPKPAGAAASWKTLSKKLKEGFLFKKEDSKSLRTHWSEIFGYEYEYDAAAVKRSFVLDRTTNRYSEDFYRFQAYADDTLVRLYGDKPRG